MRYWGKLYSYDVQTYLLFIYRISDNQELKSCVVSLQFFYIAAIFTGDLRIFSGGLILFFEIKIENRHLGKLVVILTLILVLNAN